MRTFASLYQRFWTFLHGRTSLVTFFYSNEDLLLSRGWPRLLLSSQAAAPCVSASATTAPLCFSISIHYINVTFVSKWLDQNQNMQIVLHSPYHAITRYMHRSFLCSHCFSCSPHLVHLVFYFIISFFKGAILIVIMITTVTRDIKF
jgi:hypothetical protein